MNAKNQNKIDELIEEYKKENKIDELIEECKSIDEKYFQKIVIAYYQDMTY